MKSSFPCLVLVFCVVFATVGARPTFDKIADALIDTLYGDVTGYSSRPHSNYHGGGGYDHGYHQSGGYGGYYEEQAYGYGQPHAGPVRPPIQPPVYYQPPAVYGHPPPNGYNGGYHAGGGGYQGHVTVGGDYAYGQHRPHGYKQHGY